MLQKLIISATMAVMSLASAAQAQDLMGFDRASFGSVVLSRTQAVGTGIQLELSVGSYENEPMSNYKDTVFADIGRSVGRLDVLTDKGTFPCTAFIVSKQHILTNYHCSLGLLDDERIGATRIDASQFVAGYTQTGVDEGTKKFTVIPTPVETNAELDYAVLEVIGNPSQEFGELKLASLVPKDRAPFWIIGHPQGKGQHISREKCRASTPAVSRNTLLHTCDTLPGNSGSPVIDAGLQQVVALHHAGIANDSVNAAILMSKILENSTVLAAYKAPEEAPKSLPVEPKTAANSACDALYSATAETKACYAYDAFLKSCADHALAPLARGYINEFCQPKEMVKVDKVPEKTCDDDPNVCSTDQLCGQSVTFESGDAEWSVDNARYVLEAKRRDLSCGVSVASISDQEDSPLIMECDKLTASSTEPIVLQGKVKGVPDDRLDGWKALDACRKALDKFPEHTRTWFHMGRAYFKLRHIESVHWFRRAALDGYVSAQQHLWMILIFPYGLGIPLDYIEGVKWLREAAKAGDIMSAANLILFLQNGQFLEKNTSEAAQLYLSFLSGGFAYFQKPDVIAGLSSETITELQKILAQEGVYLGAIDGMMGPQTEMAMKTRVP